MDDFVRDMHTVERPAGGDPAVGTHPGRGRTSDPRVHPGPRPEAPHRAPGRQLDRHRPPVPGRPPARDRGVPALPVGRRLDRQGAGRAAGIPRPWPPPRRRPVATGPWTTSGSPWPSWRTTGPPSSGTPPPEAGRRGRTAATPEREEHPWPTSTDRPDDGPPADDPRRRRAHPGRGGRHPDRPGRALRDGGGRRPGHAARGRGRPHPATCGPCSSCPPSTATRTSSSTRTSGSPSPSTTGPWPRSGTPTRRALRRPTGRPGGHRHAQPARLGHGLLGHHHRRCGRRAPQRLVDRRGARLRARPTPAAGSPSSTRSARSGSPTTWPRSPGSRP